jgi:hypothetical protein
MITRMVTTISTAELKKPTTTRSGAIVGPPGGGDQIT